MPSTSTPASSSSHVLRALLIVAAAAGCGDNATDVPVDGGRHDGPCVCTIDAGPTPMIDASPMIVDAAAPDASSSVDAGPIFDAGPAVDAGMCPAATIAMHPLLPGVHVATGTDITTWNSNPPSSGSHYPQWAKWFHTYDTPIPRGNYVHNLEHGGVIILYNCPGPGGCPDVVTQLTTVMYAAPVDPSCVIPIQSRTLITPDPLLPPGVQVAATAWGWTYTASCLDVSSLSAFIAAHLDMGPENLCGDGQIP